MQNAKPDLKTTLDGVVLKIVDNLEFSLEYPDGHLRKVRLLIEDVCKSREPIGINAYYEYDLLYGNTIGDCEEGNIFIKKYGGSDPRYFYSDEKIPTRLIKCSVGGLFGCAAGFLFLLFAKDLIPIAGPILGIYTFLGSAVGCVQKEMSCFIDSYRYGDEYDALCSYHDGLYNIRDNIVDGLDGKPLTEIHWDHLDG